MTTPRSSTRPCPQCGHPATPTGATFECGWGEWACSACGARFQTQMDPDEPAIDRDLLRRHPFGFDLLATSAGKYLADRLRAIWLEAWANIEAHHGPVSYDHHFKERVTPTCTALVCLEALETLRAIQNYAETFMQGDLQAPRGRRERASVPFDVVTTPESEAVRERARVETRRWITVFVSAWTAEPATRTRAQRLKQIRAGRKTGSRTTARAAAAHCGAEFIPLRRTAHYCPKHRTPKSRK